ncbi:MAG: PTS sugar transporter subunit IIA [Desulfobulbaceae bacterium]|jgi:PTS system nitrogen regulatory IIA component|nr:PTS sugar transporter subunit IIA [Desulfobulbus sp.]MBP8037048.1 PTS sugar transporter subunit IIA [Desulfobulbus sp.]MBP8814878.1 PTS sugar transporter subunit IIA [Desulfobulbus sp.]NLB06134.1 PTS sugar transporter subunit IIA [Desulfobulbaceae bacterium]
MQPLDNHAIILEMQATGKEGALRELAALAATRCGRCTAETLYTILLEREAIGSTGVGNGVAIPHGKVAGLDDILLCFGRSRDGIDFDAIDSRPVHLFVLLLSPASKAAEYLKALARVSRILKNETTRQELLASSSPEAIVTLFEAGPPGF